MGTLSISAAGFTTLPAAAPTNWPVTVTWPGAVSPNGTKTYTVSDADWVMLLTWIASLPDFAQQSVITSPSPQQLLLSWVQRWITQTLLTVQRFFTPNPVMPSPLGFN